MDFRDPLRSEHREILRRYISFAIGKDVSGIIGDPIAMTGGIENRNYRFTVVVDGENQSFVLRCPPEEIPEWREDEYDLGREYRILREIHPFSMGTPKAWGYDPEGEFFGVSCFLMECLPGRSLYHSFFPSRDPSLVKEFAQRVTAITRLPYESSTWLRECLPKWPMERTMDWLEWRSRRYSADPLVKYALSWLGERQPRPGEVVFCHGDVNPTNFLVTGGHITGIVDWEFASLKDDPLGEVEFFCWLYDGELVKLGFTREFCKALGRNEEELDWFFTRAWFGITFASDDTDPRAFQKRRTHLARCVGFMQAR